MPRPVTFAPTESIHPGPGPATLIRKADPAWPRIRLAITWLVASTYQARTLDRAVENRCQKHRSGGLLLENYYNGLGHRIANHENSHADVGKAGKHGGANELQSLGADDVRHDLYHDGGEDVVDEGLAAASTLWWAAPGGAARERGLRGSPLLVSTCCPLSRWGLSWVSS